MKVAVCGLILGFATGCLPDNFWTDKLGEIVNSLIITAANTALAGTGLGL
jgi:hypothetical protein